MVEIGVVVGGGVGDAGGSALCLLGDGSDVGEALAEDDEDSSSTTSQCGGGTVERRVADTEDDDVAM